MTDHMHCSGKTKNVEQVYGDACKEIMRRKASSFVDSSVFSATKSGSSSSDKQLSDQIWVLVTFGTPVLSPRPCDPLHPIMRVYGVFQTKQEGLKHSTRVRKEDDECSLILVKRGEWILLPVDEQSRDDERVNERRLKTTLTNESERRRQEDVRFQQAVDTKSFVEAKGSMETKAERTEREEEEEEAEKTVYPPPQRLSSRVAEVRGQGYLAMNAIPNNVNGECAVRILGLFPSVEETEEWVQNVGCKDFPDHDIMIADTCEWLSPNGGSTSSKKTLYAHKELQKIMDASDQNVTSVRDYKKEESEEREASLLAQDETQ